MYSRDKIVRICTGGACRELWDDRLIREIERELETDLGSYNDKKGVGFFECQCLGDCGKGPTIKIGRKIYSEVTNAKAPNIMEMIRTI